ncbi:hypothetical protein Tco_1222129 [Tanacetum coccineum]
MAKTINEEVQLHAIVDGKKIIITKSSVRRDLQLADEEDEAVHKELVDSLVRDATAASSLEAEQDSDGGPRVLDLEQTKTSQHNEIESLKRRVKKLEKKDSDEESLGEDASKQERINAIDVDDDITLVSVQNVDEEIFVSNEEDDQVNVVEEVVEVVSAAKKIINAAQVSVVGDMVSTASATTIVSAATTTTAMTGDDITLSQDKGKAISIEPMKPLKKKDQIRLDEDLALNLQAEFDEEERLAREKPEKEKEANIALIETWDDI